MADTVFEIKVNADAESAKPAAGSLADLAAKMIEVGTAAHAADLAIKAQAAGLSKTQTAAEAAAKAVSKTTAAEAAAAKKKKPEDTSKTVAELAGGLEKLGGPLGAAGGKIEKLIKGFGDLGKNGGSAGVLIGGAAVGVVAFAAAIVVATVAIAHIVTEIALWAIGLADANEQNFLLLDGLSGVKSGGDALAVTFANIQSHAAFSNKELSDMAKKLKDSGLKGDELNRALEKTAIEAAKAKWGEDFEKSTLSIAFQTDRLRGLLTKLFSGLKIEKIIAAFSHFIDLFDETESTGKAIKVVFESIFQPLIDGVTDFAPKAEAAFIQFEIFALKALIAIKPHRAIILKIAEGLAVLAAVIVGVIVLAVGILAVSLAAVGATIFALGQVFSFIGNAILAFVRDPIGMLTAAWGFVVGAIQSAIAFILGISFSDIGTKIIDGLVNGIKAAGGKILEALTGAVSGAIDGAKKLLGISSPSAVFAEIGLNTATGMAQGVDAGAARVDASISDLVAPPSVAPTSPTGGGATSNLSGATFNFYGVEGAEDAIGRFEAVLTRVLEGDVTTLGAGRVTT